MRCQMLYPIRPSYVIRSTGYLQYNIRRYVVTYAERGSDEVGYAAGHGLLPVRSHTPYSSTGTKGDRCAPPEWRNLITSHTLAYVVGLPVKKLLLVSCNFLEDNAHAVQSTKLLNFSSNFLKVKITIFQVHDSSNHFFVSMLDSNSQKANPLNPLTLSDGVWSQYCLSHFYVDSLIFLVYG